MTVILYSVPGVEETPGRALIISDGDRWSLSLSVVKLSVSATSARNIGIGRYFWAPTSDIIAQTIYWQVQYIKFVLYHVDLDSCLFWGAFICVVRYWISL